MTSNRQSGENDSSRVFEELIAQWGDKAYNFAYRLSGNEAEARDLVSEAFARALAHFGKFDRTRAFDSWLLRILRNIYLDGVRLYAHSRTLSLDAPANSEEDSWRDILPGNDPDPSHPLVQKETQRLIQKALNAVPVYYRTAVTLADLEGLSYEKISEIMDCPVGTVRSRIHQGRQLFKKAYESFEAGKDLPS